MKCQKCGFDNKPGKKFCIECGTSLTLKCPQCDLEIEGIEKFCGECGQDLHTLTKSIATEKIDAHQKDSNLQQLAEDNTCFPTEGERKYVTVLFSDLTGYTTMSEKLDPEEVKEITSRIFGEVAQVIAKYEGFIEKFIGDAVLAIFGATKTHEDDPVRAIRAAEEIHNIVKTLSPQYEERIGQPLAMHSGISTGLVVTGEINTKKGTHGLAGDTINLAARLCSHATANEIFVGSDTYKRAEGYYTFEGLQPQTIKGKTKPIHVFKVLDKKERPITIHRLSGVRAELIGRRAEVGELREALLNLENGKGKVFTICGDAGTGKSRLVEEFKATLDLEKIQWLEGHAYAYAQNIPYFPLIDLLNRIFQIEETDAPATIRHKLDGGIADLLEKGENLTPYIGSLYSLDYPEIESVSPEFWRTRLRKGVKMIISALARRAPTIFFLEDLHWADPSFGELLRHTLLEVNQQPAIVLCVYRPVFNLFTAYQAKSIGKLYHEIRLKDLSASEAQDMLESLLKNKNIPGELRRFVQNKAEGNPFYLEEMINSLIETDTIYRDNGDWKLTQSITEAGISSTVNGVISDRIDRLEKETKRIIQEASVIGRAFFYDILKQITQINKQCDECLSSLERLDLIRTRTFQPDIEYIFKHALAQEVVYNGILKKERQKIHERIATVIENMFQNRLSEFYETLAYHFTQGQSTSKAVHYLMKSGEKSVTKYSVEESHQYYKEAYELLAGKANKTLAEKELLLELIINWAYVFYYRGDFNGMAEIFSVNKTMAESIENKTKLGMFYAWYGWTLGCQNKFAGSYTWLEKALQVGEGNKDPRVIGYACTWLTWFYLLMGNPEQAIKHGEKAQEISKVFTSDAYLYFKSLTGLGFTHGACGRGKKALKIGSELVEHGIKHSNIRSLTMGHACIGIGYSACGDLNAAIKSYEDAMRVGAEPFYTEYIRMNLALVLIMNGQIEKAEDALNRVVSFSGELGAGAAGIPAQAFLGAIFMAKGQMSRGLKRLTMGKQELLANENVFYYLQCEYCLGKIFSQIAIGSEPISLTMILKNIGFLVKYVPFATKRAERHLNKAIEVAREIGAKCILGSACLDLGLLYRAKKRTDNAKQYILEAIDIFEQCEAEILVKQAKEAYSTLT